VAFFDVSAVAVTVMVYVPAAVGVQTTALLPLLAHPEPDAGLTDNVKSAVFCLVTLKDKDCPTATFAGDGAIFISTTGGGVVTVKVAVALLDVSSVAVTVMVYAPTAVGVQVTASLPLLTQPAAAGAYNVKSFVLCLVTLSVPVAPTVMLND
jgi:hypothetical protein